jgi:hypothetical protein
MTIQGLLPRLITGKAVSTTRMLEELEDWSDEDIKYNLSEFPARYEEIAGGKMSDFTGLNVCTELIKLLKEQKDEYRYHAVIIHAQKRALHYHNLQFKNK